MKPREKKRLFKSQTRKCSTSSEESDSDLKFTESGDSDFDNPDDEVIEGDFVVVNFESVKPVVHNWFIKDRGMYCSVYGKVHIKDPLLLIEKSSLCGGSGFPSKKCVNVTI